MKLLNTGLIIACLATSAMAADSKFTDRFDVERSDLVSTGTNRYFILQPGYQMTLEGKEHGKKVVLVVTVLDETKNVDGVETRVVEERETVNGEPEETSRNYFAISRCSGDLYYFGEDVDIFKNGKVTSHEGAWHSGEKGAHFGLYLPGLPLVGARYYQEMAPKVAMDRAEIVSLNEELETGAGKFRGCVKTEETSAFERGREHKIYAPGIGLVFDGTLKATRYGFVSR